MKIKENHREEGTKMFITETKLINMLNIKGTFMFPECQRCKGKWHRLNYLRKKKVYHIIIYNFLV